MNRSSKSDSNPRDSRAVGHHQVAERPEDLMREDVSEKDMRQPNERDASPDSGRRGTDRRTDIPQTDIRRAHADVEKGLVDTDRRGVPADVPSSSKNRAR